MYHTYFFISPTQVLIRFYKTSPFFVTMAVTARVRCVLFGLFARSCLVGLEKAQPNTLPTSIFVRSKIHASRMHLDLTWIKTLKSRRIDITLHGDKNGMVGKVNKFPWKQSRCLKNSPVKGWGGLSQNFQNFQNFQN